MLTSRYGHFEIKLDFYINLWYAIKMAHYTLNFDGSCGPKNPGGTGAYGYVLKNSIGDNIDTGHDVIGSGPQMSNNLAEFVALAEGLRGFERLGAYRGDTLAVRGDSKLVIMVMNKLWRSSREKLYYEGWVLADEAVIRLRKMGVTITFDHVYRDLNQECDDLSKDHREKEVK
jgi:ribonuclease HI